MKYILIFTSLLLSAQIAFSNSNNDELSCLFEKPFIYGASISAGYSGLRDTAKSFAKHQINEGRHLGKNPGPVSRLSKKYNQETDITNISEMIESSYHSYDQFFDHLNSENRNDIYNSSVIASLDSLYWPAIYGLCDEAIKNTQQIIRFAKLYKKPLILATIPEENKKYVPTYIKGVQVKENSYLASWRPPDVACLNKINNFLENACQIENNCYLLDIHYIVKDLEGKAYDGDEPGLEFNGETYYYNDIRGDGIHINHKPYAVYGHKYKVPLGNQYLMFKLEDLLLSNSNVKFCSQ